MQNLSKCFSKKLYHKCSNIVLQTHCSYTKQKEEEGQNMSKNIINKPNKFDGHEFKKSLGQNFISDKNLLCAIGADSGVNESDYVVEVGAGAGTLTEIIAERCKQMISFEVDLSLEERLREVENTHPNLKVIFQDIMNVDLNGLCEEFGEPQENFKYKVVANLPYYITTPIIFKFLDDAKHLESLTIMVQKEVAERMVAKAGKGEYGALSCMIDFYGDAKIERIVKRQNFYPMPKVDSAIVKIDIVNNKYDFSKEEAYKKIVRTAFNNRRKTLVHNITNELKIARDKVLSVFHELGIEEKARGEELSTQMLFNLALSLEI